MASETKILAAVDAWLAASAKPNAPPALLVALWGEAIVVVWRRGSLTLGEFTLAVIFERVVLETAARHPLARHITLADHRPDLRALHAAGASATAADVRAAMRDFLSAYISLIDVLTGGILTPVLCNALEKSGRP